MLSEALATLIALKKHICTLTVFASKKERYSRLLRKTIERTTRPKLKKKLNNLYKPTCDPRPVE